METLIRSSQIAIETTYYAMIGAGIGAALAYSVSLPGCAAHTAYKHGSQLLISITDGASAPIFRDLGDTFSHCMQPVPILGILGGVALGGTVGLIIGVSRQLYHRQHPQQR